MDHRAYYRGRFIDQTIDNPDQRIQQDVDIFTTGVRADAEPSVVRHERPAAVRRDVIHHLGVFIRHPSCGTCPGPCHCSATRCRKRCSGSRSSTCCIATIVAFWIGRPLIRLSFRNELTNAAFRYALVRLRDAAEAVSFYRGERAERVQLRASVRSRSSPTTGITWGALSVSRDGT